MDLGADVFGGGGPYVGFGVLFVGFEVGLNARDEVRDACEDPASQVAFGQVAEPAFDLLEPA